jgi:germination protein M
MRYRVPLLALVAVIALAAAAVHAAAAETSVYQVWFQRSGKLWVVKREQPVTTAPGKAAMQALLAGPNAAESNAGVSTQLPGSTDLLGLNISNGTATVDLSSDLTASGTTAQVRMRLAQITYTLEQFPTVDRVALHVNGRAVKSLAGVTVPTTMTKDTFDGLVPVLTIWNPAIGSQLASGAVRVTGNARVSDGHVHVSILNQKGATIAQVNTTAGCSAPCRGGFTVNVPFTVVKNQLGTIVVSDDDTDGNGSPQHQVKEPVVLLS